MKRWILGVFLAALALLLSVGPVLAGGGSEQTNAGTGISIVLSATDPDGDPLTYSSSQLPAGATFDNVTHTFSWTPTEDQVGVWVIRFTVTDPGGLSDFEDVSISVFSRFDLNQDWAVNVLDMILLGQHFGESWPH